MNTTERWDYCDECGEQKIYVKRIRNRKRPAHTVKLCFECLTQMRYDLLKKFVHLKGE